MHVLLCTIQGVLFKSTHYLKIILIKINNNNYNEIIDF